MRLFSIPVSPPFCFIFLSFLREIIGSVYSLCVTLSLFFVLISLRLYQTRNNSNFCMKIQMFNLHSNIYILVDARFSYRNLNIYELNIYNKTIGEFFENCLKIICPGIFAFLKIERTHARRPSTSCSLLHLYSFGYHETCLRSRDKSMACSIILLEDGEEWNRDWFVEIACKCFENACTLDTVFTLLYELSSLF